MVQEVDPKGKQPAASPPDLKETHETAGEAAIRTDNDEEWREEFPYPWDEDEIVMHPNGAALAELTHGRLLTMEGSGHIPHLRDPVKVNLALRDFALPARPRAANKSFIDLGRAGSERVQPRLDIRIHRGLR